MLKKLFFSAVQNGLLNVLGLSPGQVDKTNRFFLFSVRGLPLISFPLMGEG
jgi:hypothetical protein